ncbi:MAG: hypothetical protein H6828_15430 [Planctomycetes bacterium]|nr:hypothetical protein [Planctomycetota bacterium]
MSHDPRRTSRARRLALAALLLAACDASRATPLEPSLARAEALLALLEPIADASAARAAAPALARWSTARGEHDLRTARLEAVSGPAYAALLEATSARSAALRARLHAQLERLPADAYLEPYRRHVDAALALLPPATGAERSR